MKKSRKKQQSHFLEILQHRQESGLKSHALIRAAFENVGQFSSLDLKAHFGCVNALSFSKNGQFLASGGDDKRVLLWPVAQTLHNHENLATRAMEGMHNSNIFSLDFDCSSEVIISGANDQSVIVHDMATGKPKDVFPHDEPVYCVNGHPDTPHLFASAGSDGRALIFDLRMSKVRRNVA